MKTEKPGNIDQYISAFPSNVQEILQKVRSTIRAVLPNAEEAIKYDIPTFVENGNVVHFAGYEHHIGFYPAPIGMETFKEELSRYKTGKGSVQFPLNKPIPYDLISRITHFRIEEMNEKAARKKVNDLKS